MHKHPLLYINFALLAVIVLLILGVNANNLNLPQPLKVLAQTASQIISGTGTPTSMAQFTGSYTLGNSQIYQDGAGRIGIGTQNPSSAYKLDVIGNARTLDTWLDRANSGAGAWASTLSAPSTISWNSITGKPAGFADNTDDVGSTGATYTGIGNITINGSNQVNTVGQPTFSQGINGAAWVGHKWVPNGTEISCVENYYGSSPVTHYARVNNGRIETRHTFTNTRTGVSRDSGWQNVRYLSTTEDLRLSGISTVTIDTYLLNGQESYSKESSTYTYGGNTPSEKIIYFDSHKDLLGYSNRSANTCTANWP